MPPSDSTLALLARAISGDRQAENEFTHRFLLPTLDAAITRYRLQLSGMRFEKEDVIQEVFQHLYDNRWARLRPYDPQKGSLATYVWAIAGNWIRDHSRRLPPPRPTEAPEKDLAPDSGPEGKAQLGEILDRLGRELNEEDWALFQWIYFEGVSRAVAAARLELSMEALYKRVQRMETRIKAIVSDPNSDGIAKGEEGAS